jgi:His/Glu/Gln/Arg/opine family amino acid ABC transporter permease subunit
VILEVVAQTTFRWDFIWDSRWIFFQGVKLTMAIALVSFALSSALGLLVAVLRMSKNRIVQPLIASYVNVFRAIPLLVFILFVYYGVAIQFNLNASAIQAGVLALTLQYSAWLGEIFRSGIQAVPHGQREASLSLGMSRVQTFFRVVIPQAARIVIPPTGNMFIGMIKDSSLVYIIGVAELLRVSNRLANRTFRYFEVYLATVLIYLALTMAVYFIVKYLEKRYAPLDVLTAPARSWWSPTAKRRANRLRQLQHEVLAAKGIHSDGIPAEDTADIESLELSPPETINDDERSTHS